MHTNDLQACEQCRFIFASTSSDQFSYASCEHFRNTKWRAASTSLIFRQLESLFIKTLLCAKQSGWHFKNRTTGAKLSYMLRSYRGSTILSSLQPNMPRLYAVCCKITSLSFARVNGWTLNGICSFLRPCLQASRFPLKKVKESPPLQAKFFRVPYYLRVKSGPSVSINVNNNQKHSWRAHISPMFPSFPYRKHCFQCQVLFPRWKLYLHYTGGNFKENLSMRARASEQSSNFCEQFEQRPNFTSTFKLEGTIRYPS